jgi:hypothetical protein
MKKNAPVEGKRLYYVMLKSDVPMRFRADKIALTPNGDMMAMIIPEEEEQEVSHIGFPSRSSTSRELDPKSSFVVASGEWVYYGIVNEETGALEAVTL